MLKQEACPYSFIIYSSFSQRCSLCLRTATTDIESRNTRIVITDLIIKVLPCVEVKMLVLGALLKRGAGIHVVECLGVHVEEVGVPLDGVHFHDVVHITEARFLGKYGHGLYLSELVKVAGGDDSGFGILFEDLSNECLLNVSLSFH